MLGSLQNGGLLFVIILFPLRSFQRLTQELLRSTHIPNMMKLFTLATLLALIVNLVASKTLAVSRVLVTMQHNVHAIEVYGYIAEDGKEFSFSISRPIRPLSVKTSRRLQVCGTLHAYISLLVLHFLLHTLRIWLSLVFQGPILKLYCNRAMPS